MKFYGYHTIKSCRHYSKITLRFLRLSHKNDTENIFSLKPWGGTNQERPLMPRYGTRICSLSEDFFGLCLLITSSTKFIKSQRLSICNSAANINFDRNIFVGTVKSSCLPLKRCGKIFWLRIKSFFHVKNMFRTILILSCTETILSGQKDKPKTLCWSINFVSGFSCKHYTSDCW